MIKAIIFDNDGVLIDCKQNIVLLSKIMNRELIKTDPEHVRKYFGMSVEEYIRWLKPDINDNDLSRIAFEFRQGKINNKAPLCAGVKEFLKKLKQKNMKLGVASSATISSIKRILKEKEIFEFFDYIQGFENLGHKPLPDIYNECIINLDVDPKECIIFEDSLEGIEAAKRADVGIAIAVLTGGNNKTEFQKMDKKYKPDYILNDITEFDFNLLK